MKHELTIKKLEKFLKKEFNTTEKKVLDEILHIPFIEGQMATHKERNKIENLKK
jgi:hypothetical protein